MKKILGRSKVALLFATAAVLGMVAGEYLVPMLRQWLSG